MSTTVIGSQSGDSEKTPTLREYLKRVGKVPQRCYVKTVFLPKQSGSYGLVCDPGFRVSIPESSPLFPTFRALYEDIESTSLCLFVHVTDTERVHWQLESCDRNITEWETAAWGLRSTKVAQPVSASEKAATLKGRNRKREREDNGGSAGSSLKAV